MPGFDLFRVVKSATFRRSALPCLLWRWSCLLFVASFVFLRVSYTAELLYQSQRNPQHVERRRAYSNTAYATQNDTAAGTKKRKRSRKSTIIPEDGDGYSTNGKFRTHRVGCRTYPKGGQSCVLSGIACVDVNRRRTNVNERPLICLVDDTRRNGERVESDGWCDKRHFSADPRYFGPREWPLVDYFAPRQSCLNAQWRTKFSLLENGTRPNVRWVDDFSLIDLDYINNNHNNHYLKDIVWLLDVALWQKNLETSSTLPRGNHSFKPSLFTAPKHIMFPQGTSDFVKQTSRDVNRVNLAIILGLDARELYRGQNNGRDVRLFTRPFLEAFPSSKEVRFIFYEDERLYSTHDLVCTRKLTVGAKLGNMGHERVWTHLRESAWKLYGLTRPEFALSGGYLRYHRPPRRVVLLRRHKTRGFRNVGQLYWALKRAALKYGFEFTIPPRI